MSESEKASKSSLSDLVRDVCWRGQGWGFRFRFRFRFSFGFRFGGGMT